MPDFTLEIDKLRSTISAAIADALYRFNEQTGITPSAINIAMIETTTMGVRAPSFVLGEVRIKFEA